jgi:hypothetical protein
VSRRAGPSILTGGMPYDPAAVAITGGTMSGVAILYGVEDTLTAHAGGGQGSALALSATKSFHRISVCATAGDSVALPAATAGCEPHYVRNDGAAACQVYGTSPDTINGIATGTGVSLPAGQGCLFFSTTAAKWTAAPGVGPFTGTVLSGTTAVRGPDGSAAVVGLGFNTAVGTGFFLPGGAGYLQVGIATVAATLFDGTSVYIKSTGGLLFTSGTDPYSSPPDSGASRLAPGVVAFGTGAVGSVAGTLALTELDSYGAYTSASNYSRAVIKHATATLSAVSGASVTATNLIPAKANVLGVNTRVTTGLGTGGGTTGYTVGDGSDADRWGAVTGTIAGTDTDGNDATADPTSWFTAANNVVITAAGGNFNGTGAIFIDVAYTLTEAE